MLTVAYLVPFTQEMGADMTGNETADQIVNTEQSAEKENKYERSTIEFPYGDLDDALEVARHVHENAGTNCTTDQLAGWMGQTTSSGAFRGKLATARIFGLIETERGKVSLSLLGRKIVNPTREHEARAQAFLTVRLYKAIDDKYKGHLLPPSAGLEREMANLGVSSKQTGKARQAFERSAQQAGFFAHGSDRLIMPAGARAPETVPIKEPPAREDDAKQLGGNGGGGTYHPFIEGLLQALPQPASKWSVHEQAKWLQTAANIFGLIYEGDGEIKVEVNQSARPQKPMEGEPS